MTLTILCGVVVLMVIQYFLILNICRSDVKENAGYLRTELRSEMENKANRTENELQRALKVYDEIYENRMNKVFSEIHKIRTYDTDISQSQIEAVKYEIVGE